MLILLPINALICWGFYFACQFENYESFDAMTKEERHRLWTGKPGGRMIFWWVRFYGGKGLPEWVQKPLFLCVICMSSFHSILPYFYTQGVSVDTIIKWPFYVMALAGLNALLMYKGFND